MSSDNAADAQLSVSTAGLDIAEQLAVGELTLKKQIVTGNNAVFIAEVSAADSRGKTQEQAQKPVLRCVYKPIAGERPLWDFPDAQLALREVAAYVVDRVWGGDLSRLPCCEMGRSGRDRASCGSNIATGRH